MPCRLGGCPLIPPKAQRCLTTGMEQAAGGQPLRAQRRQIGQLQFATETPNAAAGIESLGDGLLTQARADQPPGNGSRWGQRLPIAVGVDQPLQPGAQCADQGIVVLMFTHQRSTPLHGELVTGRQSRL